ncbi:hypothetical protein [Stenotrophomonas maltophilia]|uniref:hypothetical protein n=1 Tax=Stenotrophomonas maltophilia TaxID=40324 RepID=UPI000DA7B053|nr:hypothetical protein [Stenotrophomonas maltophilia]PZS42745.1 hypothetical protein A7X60_01575 [Stenotrophomonas maltophilia]
MDAIEKRARELVMAEIPDLAKECFGYQRMTVVNLHVVMRILRAALTPPEGYVLVPVVLPDPMLDALYRAEGDMSDADMQSLWADILAARPEVKP